MYIFIVSRHFFLIPLPVLFIVHKTYISDIFFYRALHFLNMVDIIDFKETHATCK